MRPLSRQFVPYAWAPSTAEVARRAGIPAEQVKRFDGNTAPRPPRSARPELLADELARVNTYRHGGYPDLVEAIARYAGVGPENVVLGVGADDLLLLVARACAGPGDVVSVPQQPTYPLIRGAVWIAGADVGDEEPVLTFCCRPNNPTGELFPLPAARPLAVDEAYFEFADGETAAGLIDEDDVIVIRSFSKAFALAGARVGYALASPATAAELNARQAPAPIPSLSAALVLAGLADPPDVSAVVEERERLTAELRALGLDPPRSHGNFVYVPLERAREVAEALLLRGMPVRASDEAIRVTVRGRADDDGFVRALAELL